MPPPQPSDSSVTLASAHTLSSSTDTADTADAAFIASEASEMSSMDASCRTALVLNDQVQVAIDTAVQQQVDAALETQVAKSRQSWDADCRVVLSEEIDSKIEHASNSMKELALTSFKNLLPPVLLPQQLPHEFDSCKSFNLVGDRVNHSLNG